MLDTLFEFVIGGNDESSQIALCYLSGFLYKDFAAVSYISNKKFLDAKFIGKQHIKAKQFHFKFSFCFRLLGKTKSRIWLATLFWKSHGSQVFDQTNKTETPNLVSKTKLANR